MGEYQVILLKLSLFLNASLPPVLVNENNIYTWVHDIVVINYWGIKYFRKLESVLKIRADNSERSCSCGS